ncbi:hypothetical protein [Methanobrevibacter sp. DSM 116169]|uniref:hypothetical protein n=1 Tax=Methanobrevibacter sp. DSM 116169 TaxID=3242727 RepID=UPI0038FCEECC
MILLIITCGLLINISTISATDNITNIADNNDIERISYTAADLDENEIKFGSAITSQENNIHYNQKEKFNVTLIDSNNQPLANKNVTISVNGVDYVKVTDSNGVAGLTINLIPGDYHVKYFFDGDENTAPSYGEDIIHVIKKEIQLEAKDLNMDYKDGSKFTVKVTDKNNNILANENIIFTINGIDYVRTTNSEGYASLNINLGSGIYNILYKIENSGIYNSASGMKNIFIHGYGQLIASNLNVAHKTKGAFKVTYYNSLGQVVSGVNVFIKVNGIIYERITDENGVASLNINLNLGSYLVEYSAGDLSGSNIVNILSSELSGNDLELTSTGNYFEVTLKDNNGNLLCGEDIVFTINGIQYIRTTDSQGVAKLQINLKDGSYVISSEYNGNSQYSESYIQNIINIKTLNTITATGKPSCVSCSKKISSGQLKYTDYTTVYLNYCPLCKSQGTLTINPKGVYEGEITCKNCDADYCIVSGSDKMYNSRGTLTTV